MIPETFAENVPDGYFVKFAVGVQRISNGKHEVKIML